MSLFKVGRMCLKLAGRDAGRKCVVVEKIDNVFVVVDGSTRRKKVNVKHLEPLPEVIEIKDKASHEEVKSAFGKLGLPVWNKKSKKPVERPKKQKIKKVKPVKEKIIPAKEKKPAEEKKSVVEQKETVEKVSREG